MKIKFVAILMVIPLLGMAHAGHEHKVSEIIFNPFSWADHGVIMGASIILLLLVTRKLVKKYSIAAYRALTQKK